MSTLLTGIHTQFGLIWAAVDPEVHHITGRVATSRFGARLSPFKTQEEAEAALIAAGAAIASATPK